MISRFVFGRKGMDYCTSFFNLTAMRSLIILGTRIKFIDFRPQSADRPILFLSNHQSMWDIPPMMWKFRKNHPKFVAKKELAKFIPSVSFNINYGGSVAIDRSKPKQAISLIKGFAKYLDKNNFSACIFPEGTRSINGQVKQFKKSGIEAILKEMPRALVIPIGIKNTAKIDQGGNFIKNIGVRIEFKMFNSRTIDLNHLERDLEIIRNEIKEFVEN
jgi:1-acyl-sn-glycerol-3-phosphate acyltransferase